MLGAHDFDQHAAERRDCNIDQVSYRQARGLEIDADHGSDLEIDEQEENVSQARAALRGHADESCGPRPNGRPANCEQGEVMKCVDQKLANRVGRVLHAPMPAAGRTREPAHYFQHGSLLVYSLTSLPFWQPQCRDGASAPRASRSSAPCKMNAAAC